MGRLTQLHAETTDVGEAAQSLQDAYGTPMEVRSDPRDFRFCLEGITDGSFGLARLGYFGAGVTRVESFTDFIVVMPVSGHQLWRISRQVGGGLDPYLLRPQQDLRAEWEDIDLLSLSLDTEVVETAARALGGGLSAVRAGAADPAGDSRYMREVMLHLHASVRRAPGLIAEPLVRAAMTQTAAQALLISFGVAGETPERAALPRAIRRGARFFDDHLGDPITVADAARAAGLSVRALEAGFRRELDRTPTQYLRSARLSAVRAALEAADPAEETVAAVAARWGFGHLSRFAHDYRRAFGELPSSTLRR